MPARLSAARPNSTAAIGARRMMPPMRSRLVEPALLSTRPLTMNRLVFTGIWWTMKNTVPAMPETVNRPRPRTM